VRLGFSVPTPFFESTYYYHGLLEMNELQLQIEKFSGPDLENPLSVCAEQLDEMSATHPGPFPGLHAGKLDPIRNHGHLQLIPCLSASVLTMAERMQRQLWGLSHGCGSP
jgi:hypothetical protein